MFAPKLCSKLRWPLTAHRVHTSSVRHAGTAAAMAPAASPEQATPPVLWDPQVKEYMAASLGDQQFAAMQAALAVPPLHTCVRVNMLRATPQDVAQQLHGLLAAAPDPAAAGSELPDSSTGAGGTSSRYGITCHPQIPAVILQGSGPHAVDLSAVTKQVLISRKAGEAVLRGAHVFVPGVLGCSAGVCAADTVAVMVDLGSPSATRGMVLPAVQPQQPQLWLCAGIGQACVGRVEMFRLQHGVAVQLTQRLYDVPSLNGQLPGLVMLQNLPSIVAAQVLAPPPGSRVLDMCAAPGGKTTMLAQLMRGVGQVYALDRSHAKVDDIRSLAQELGVSGCVRAFKMDATKAVAADGVGLQDTQEQEQMQQQQQQQQQQEQQEGAAAADGSGNQAAQKQQQSQLQQGEGQALQQQADTQPLEPLQERQQQQQQQQQQAGKAPQGMSAKAAQRLARRLAAMSARGHTAPPGEFRRCGSAPAAPKCPGFAPESFSHVLLDAPCTALGLRPKLAQPLTLQELLEAAAYQRQLLAAAVRLVRPGGYLVFSTCSVSPAENEANVRHALDTYPCLELVPAQPLVGGPGLTRPADPSRFAAVLAEAAAGCGADKPKPSVLVAAQEAAAIKEEGGCWLSEQEAAMVQRFCPAGQLDTIGFFAAKFRKTRSCNGA